MTPVAAERTSLAGFPAKPEQSDLPAPREKDLLPAIEPDRRINDWGRSERVEELFDRTLVEFFYRYWFRAEVEGVENVPSSGGALLVSNHSGALPPDAATIARAITAASGGRAPEWLETSSAPPSAGTFSIPSTSARNQ